MWVFPEIRTLGDIPRYHARRRPDATALISEGRTVSFGELDRESNAIANSLLDRRFGLDARIGFLGKNSPYLSNALFGTAKAGLTFLPLNWRLAAAEIAEILRDSECGLMFVDDDLRSLAADAVAQAGLSLPLVRLTQDLAAADGLPAFVCGHAQTDPGIEVAGDTTALQVYTSGTTGLPKGVELTHDNINYIRLCEHLDPGVPWSESDVYLMYMPNFHTSGTGLMLQSLYNGGAVSMLPAFEPAEVLRAIRDTRPSIMLIVPSALQALLDHPLAQKVDFSCFKLCMYAGSPIALPLITKAMAEMRCRFVQWYGATELVGAATLLRAEQHHFDREDQLKSCGTPVPLTEIRIVDSAGLEVPVGQVGEILIRIPSLFKGYWRKPKETAAAKVNGWYRSGDAGYLDNEGYLYIHDRIKDMIVSGGENIYSAEIERVLALHSALAASAVIGVPDAKWGEAVKALVVVRPEHRVTEAELIAFCRQHIGGYKVPKSVDFVDDLPRTASGKLQKAILRAPYWKGAVRAVG
jgi:acyl-CoA synthetase (AMP-forming)/AMP-acid ligase II